MIARIRGEHDTGWAGWRPRGAPKAAVAAGPPARSRTRRRVRHRLSRGRLLWRLLAVGVSIGVAGLAAGWWLSPGRAGALRLPATPRAWLDGYEAAAIDDPSRVCSQLFAPALARAYGSAVHGTCDTYFARITSFSVIVRRILQDGDTAVLELHQTVQPHDWSVVLSRRRGGWQAVDLLPGDPVR